MISSSDLYAQVKRAGGGGRLVPFFKAVTVYCMVGTFGGGPSAAGAAAKCAPVLCLMLCVLLREHARPERKRYARRVALGLALSALGDALLVWPQHFVAGMAAFGGAHLAYIAAFPAEPLAPRLALVSFLAAVAYQQVLSVGAALARPVAGYSLLLAGMAWRGAARPGPQRLGAALFLLSDALLGYGLFAAPLPYQQLLVMSTYYLGQLFIALSALEPLAEPHDQPLAQPRAEPLAERTGKRADDPPDGKWLSSPMDTSNAKGITDAMPDGKREEKKERTGISSSQPEHDESFGG